MNKQHQSSAVQKINEGSGQMGKPFTRGYLRVSATYVFYNLSSSINITNIHCSNSSKQREAEKNGVSELHR